VAKPPIKAPVPAPIAAPPRARSEREYSLQLASDKAATAMSKVFFMGYLHIH